MLIRFLNTRYASTNKELPCCLLASQYLLSLSPVSSLKNTEIIHLSAKIKLSLGNFYFEASQYVAFSLPLPRPRNPPLIIRITPPRTPKSIEMMEEAIFLLQIELRLRMCVKSHPNAPAATKKEAGRLTKSIKTLIISLVNLSFFYEDVRDFKRL